MAYLVSLETLSQRVLQRSNLEGQNQFFTSAEITDLINGSIAEWVDEVRGTTWNGSYSRSAWPIATLNNVQSYALSATFLSLISVDVLVTAAGPYITARPYQEEERNAFRNMPLAYGWSTGQPVYYQIQGTNISFIPVPQGTYTVTVNYIPTAPLLAEPTDTIDAINGWEEFIVLDAAIKCLMKAGGNDQIPALAGRLEQQRQRIRALAPRRDQQAAERVHVVQNAGYDGGWDY